MDILSLVLNAIKGINELAKMREDVVWNKEQCKRLLQRIDGLKTPLEMLKDKKHPDAGQQERLVSVVSTIERATAFVRDFTQKKSIFKWLKRKDYKDEFKSFHEEVSQHVGDLTLGETVSISISQTAIENAEKADEDHLEELLEGMEGMAEQLANMTDQLQDNHGEQSNVLKAIREERSSNPSRVCLLKLARRRRTTMATMRSP